MFSILSCLPSPLIDITQFSSFIFISLHLRWLQPDRSVDMQASELIVPSEGATCWENVMCTAQTRDHDDTRVYVSHMKVQCVCLCHYVSVAVCVILCVTVYATMCIIVCVMAYGMCYHALLCVSLCALLCHHVCYSVCHCVCYCVYYMCHYVYYYV